MPHRYMKKIFCLRICWTAAKYMAEKIVRYISEDRPQLLYPCFDRLFALLDSDNAFIRLGVILSVPNLLELDSQTERKWENCAGRYLRLLDTDDIAVFGNVVQSIPRILKENRCVERLPGS